jgi:quercetin dioxygenase-like cupin family protein
MRRWLGLIALCVSPLLHAGEGLLHPHDQIKQYSMHGNFQKGLATKSMGAKEFEVWRASIAVGSKTPKHVHETEEIFIILKGEILAIVGDQEVHCKAPATLICPANIPHQLINIGDEPTDQILVLGIDSQISDTTGQVMTLPWR